MAVPMVLDTLAAAEAEMGDFRSAVKDEKRALSLAKGVIAAFIISICKVT